MVQFAQGRSRGWRRPVGSGSGSGDDRIGDAADALDGEGDRVAGLQRGRVLSAAYASQLGKAAVVAAWGSPTP